MTAKANQEAQRKYKCQYDKLSTTPKYQIGDWVFVYFPSEETGKLRKLSQPWHGPYRITSRDDSDVIVTKVYFPDDPHYKSINWESRTVLYLFHVATIGMAIRDPDLDIPLSG